jgi:SP family general alpha glucoside:H+ symporter-like MFS transporter
MADTRTFSTSSGPNAARKSSITGMDSPHLTRVDTVVAIEAARATQAEVNMTLMQGIKTYPKAIGWSMLISTCIIVSI